jgi:hypothetical protein
MAIIQTAKSLELKNNLHKSAFYLRYLSRKIGINYAKINLL